MAAKKVKYGKAGQKVPGEVKVLQREIKIMENLKHANIVSYLGSGDINNVLVILMEFVPEGSVLVLIEEKGVLPEKQASRYTKHVLQGLKYLHSNNILHGDIKCANMLIAEGDIIKICDFGTSKQLNMLQTTTCSNMTKTLTGTMYYMAPEMFQAKKGSKQEYSPTVDTWSTACALVEMLTKYPPWRDYEPVQLTVAMVKEEAPDYKLSSKVSGKTLDFLDKCFSFDPQKRPKASQMLDHAFCGLANTS